MRACVINASGKSASVTGSGKDARLGLRLNGRVDVRGTLRQPDRAFRTNDRAMCPRLLNPALMDSITYGGHDSRSRYQCLPMGAGGTERPT